MDPTTLALFFALGATLSFSISSLVFTEFSKRVSVLWMNAFKAAVALGLLLLTIPIVQDYHRPPVGALASFLLSGLIGLNLGDLFLLSAFTRLGPARTLILFGFSPLIVGAGSWLAFGQPMNPIKFIAVFFLIGCLFCFSLERYRIEKKWELAGLAFALAGVALDAVGILLSRYAFESGPEISPLEGHLYRCSGALIGFAAISMARPIRLVENFRSLESRSRVFILAGSFGGTYLSLILAMNAFKIGHLASVTAIGITGPMFTTILECVIRKKAPSRYLIAAIGFFAAGFLILIGSN